MWWFIISNNYFVWELLWPLEIRNYIFRPMRMTNALLPRSSPRGNIKGHANHFSLSFLVSSLASSRTSQPAWQSTHSLCLLAAGQASQHDRAHILSLCFQAAGRTSQHERLHSLFFTDSLSYISSSPLSIMRRLHPIYGALVSRKSFFHHSSFLLNQRILRETNWTFQLLLLNSVF